MTLRALTEDRLAGLTSFALRNACVATCTGDREQGARAELNVLPSATIAIRGGKIVYLGEERSCPAVDVIFDVDGAVVLPGLVDAHTHLVFAGSRVDEFARRMAGEDYLAIAAAGGGIMSTVRATRAASADELLERGLARARLLAAHGVTACEIKSGYGLELETELRLLRVARRIGEFFRVTTTYLGAHVVPSEWKHDRSAYVRAVIEEHLPAVAAEKLADSVDVYCDEGAFSIEETEAILAAATKFGIAVRAHVGQFRDLGGAELLARIGGLSADHLEEVSDSGLGMMAAAGVRAVLLPGAWRSLRQVPLSGERLRQAGVRTAVATDLNPGTSPTADLVLMASLAVRDAGLTVEEALLGVTKIGAEAAGFAPSVGTLSLGGDADFAIFPTRDARSLGYAIGGMRAARTMHCGRLLHASDEVFCW